MHGSQINTNNTLYLLALANIFLWKTYLTEKLVKTLADDYRTVKEQLHKYFTFQNWNNFG
jgi:hypothetical protein